MRSCPECGADGKDDIIAGPDAVLGLEADERACRVCEAEWWVEGGKSEVVVQVYR